MTVRILVVDDERDVEIQFRQQYRRELREGLNTGFVTKPVDFPRLKLDVSMAIADARGNG